MVGDTPIESLSAMQEGVGVMLYTEDGAGNLRPLEGDRSGCDPPCCIGHYRGA
ncbi:MAG: hypothetical protein R3E18_09765 [Sphingomonadaceae bacterium]